MMEKCFEQRQEWMEEQQPFACWLHGAAGNGSKWKEKLLATFGTPQEVYRADKAALEKFVGAERAARLCAARGKDVRKEYEDMRNRGIDFYPFYHPAYPERLLDIPDRPFGVYVKGKIRDAGPRVAVVGARDCSPYGSFVAEKFARGLAEMGLLVISGMARGIDGIAQKAALDANGSTCAVLGCGVDICYPASNEALYREICSNGAVLSEYPPGTKPQPSLFPPRNRIISGLADAVLVVEARRKSGTSITVDMALEQGKEVFVIPGRITDRLSDGCNKLLLQGATIALSPAQVAEEIWTIWEQNRWQRKDREEMRDDNITEVFKIDCSKGEQRDVRKAVLNESDKTLLSLLDFYPISIDRLRIEMQTKDTLRNMTLPQTYEKLIFLESEGYIKQEGGYISLMQPF